jgi:hypothetical protein
MAETRESPASKYQHLAIGDVSVWKLTSRRSLRMWSKMARPVRIRSQPETVLVIDE